MRPAGPLIMTSGIFKTSFPGYKATSTCGQILDSPSRNSYTLGRELITCSSHASHLGTALNVAYHIIGVNFHDLRANVARRRFEKCFSALKGVMPLWRS